MVKSSLVTGLLAIIAFCLIVNTAIQLGFIPKANAGTPVNFAAPTEVVIVGVRENNTLLPHDERIENGIAVKIISPRKVNN